MKLRAVVLLLLSAFLFSKAHATHFAAADIYVNYLGNTDPCTGKPSLDYEVTLILYGACELINNVPSSSIGAGGHTLHWGSAELGSNFNAAMTCIDPNTGLPVGPGYDGEIVHQLCAAYAGKNACIDVANQGLYPGFRKWVFKANVTLPSAHTDWKFWYVNGDRNTGISNLDQSAKRQLYVEAGINNVAKFDISTPRFTSNPLPYICANVKFLYLNGPQNIGPGAPQQSLNTYAQAPLNGANDPYSYLSTYTYQNPIGSTIGYDVNPVSGTTEFNAPNTGKFVLAFRCDQTDNVTNTVLSYTMRDVQVSVLNCTQPAPIADTIPQELQNATWKAFSEKGNAVYVCPGSTMSFSLNAHTDNTANALYWETNIATNAPGSTFGKAGEGTSKISGTFSWTPALSDLGDHSLVFIAKDSTCTPNLPIVLPTPISIIVRVVSGLDAGPDLLTCQFNPKGHQVFVKGTDYKLKVQWSDLNGGPAIGLDSPTSIHPKIYASGLTSYLVSTPDLVATCKNRDTLTLYPDTSNRVTIFPDNPIILCKPDYLQLEAKFTGKPPLTNMKCGTDNPALCSKPDSAIIYGSPAYDRFITFDTSGPSSPIFPNAVKTSKQQFLITKNELRQYGFEPSSIQSLSFEIVRSSAPDNEFSNFTISMACTPKTELSKNDGFEPNLTTVYTAPTPIKWNLGWYQFKFDRPYNWDTTQNLIVQICYNNNANVDVCNAVMRFVPTSYTSALRLVPTDPAATDYCGTSTSPLIEAYTARPLLILAYCTAPAAILSYKWTPSNFLSDSTIQQPLAYVPKSTSYVIETFGRNGCKLYDTANIYIPEHQYSVAPADTAICYGETAPMRVKGGFAYKWYKLDDQGNYQLLYNPTNKEASCYDCPTPELKPEKTTTYKIAVYDSVWCIDTITARITVLPLPDVRVINRDTVLKYGQSLQLLASGAKLYNWMPVGSLNNANISYPIATPTEPTTYVAGGIGSNGCRAFDTVKVDIDYRDNLFIPSGFSPNGDGKNDLFKVSNLTFQKIAEFRVFNRWGQEVFMANDNTGWDGNWKGEPQDMGTYTYQIRIGFPDGYVESYKGSVTLIR